MKLKIKTNLTWEIQVALLLISCLFLGSCVNKEENRKTREFINKVENSLVQQVIIEGDSVRHFNIEERMSHYKVPELSIAIVDGGKYLILLKS